MCFRDNVEMTDRSSTGRFHFTLVTSVINYTGKEGEEGRIEQEERKMWEQIETTSTSSLFSGQ